MTLETRTWKWRWLRHVAWVLAAKVLLIVLALIGVAIFFGSGAGNPIIQRFIAHRLETVTGGHGAAFLGRGSAGRAAHRFLLGAESFPERSPDSETAGTHQS